jgi:hypothetical protein
MNDVQLDLVWQLELQQRPPAIDASSLDPWATLVELMAAAILAVAHPVEEVRDERLS